MSEPMVYWGIPKEDIKKVLSDLKKLRKMKDEELTPEYVVKHAAEVGRKEAYKSAVWQEEALKHTIRVGPC